MSPTSESNDLQTTLSRVARKGIHRGNPVSDQQALDHLDYEILKCQSQSLGLKSTGKILAASRGATCLEGWQSLANRRLRVSAAAVGSVWHTEILGILQGGKRTVIVRFAGDFRDDFTVDNLALSIQHENAACMQLEFVDHHPPISAKFPRLVVAAKLHVGHVLSSAESILRERQVTAYGYGVDAVSQSSQFLIESLGLNLANARVQAGNDRDDGGFARQVGLGERF